MSNAAGNTNRDVRKFLRSIGVKPTAENVERIGREVRRSESQNEAAERIGREVAPGLRDERGDVVKRVSERVRRDLDKRR